MRKTRCVTLFPNPSSQPRFSPAHHRTQPRRVLFNMSRLTAAQVVALGEYLQPDFDPASLTVSQLLGVFGFHGVKFPSQYTKPKLVQLFRDEIQSNAAKFKKERIRRENSQASEDGITDGHTGRPLNEGRTVRSSVIPYLPTLTPYQAATTVRRSARSRRGSQAPQGASEVESAKPEPVGIFLTR